jgi:magnesium transporter
MIRNLIEEIKAIIDSDKTEKEKKELLDDYHESDIADVVDDLSYDEIKTLFDILDKEKIADILANVENPSDILKMVENEKAADIIELMDADDAVDVLDELSEDKKNQVMDLMEPEAKSDVKLIESYPEDTIGSRMTTNYIVIHNDLSIKAAMKNLIKQAADNDNVTVIYAIDEADKFFGSIQLSDLICARDSDNLLDIIHTGYPTLQALDIVEDKIQEIKDYELASIPVLDSNGYLVGVITSSDIIAEIDEQLGEDYAKLGGLSEEEDLTEKLNVSIRKRLPWLLLLMGLGLVVSMITSTFEGVIASLPALVFFQSMVLDMSGNVGTQSLAVTIRNLSKKPDSKTIRKLIFKEVKVGFCNALIVASVAAVFITVFILVILYFSSSYGSSNSDKILIFLGGKVFNAFDIILSFIFFRFIFNFKIYI